MGVGGCGGMLGDLASTLGQKEWNRGVGGILTVLHEWHSMPLWRSSLLMSALPMITRRGPDASVPGFRWKPSDHWLCEAQ